MQVVLAEDADTVAVSILSMGNPRVTRRKPVSDSRSMSEGVTAWVVMEG